ncbi:MAG: hypothetical protein EBY29_15810 [Planctomycetes bacterium]|nr:hypothetical protein [Planctomycetota bacterium]
MLRFLGSELMKLNQVVGVDVAVLGVVFEGAILQALNFRQESLAHHSQLFKALGLSGAQFQFGDGVDFLHAAKDRAHFVAGIFHLAVGHRRHDCGSLVLS